MFNKKRLLALLVVLVMLIAAFTINVFASDAADVYQSNVYATIWSLLPPVIAIVLALITKEVYSSLFVGILTGALLYANFNLETAYVTMFTNEGFITKLADEWNVGILIFLVVLGALVVLMNRAGGSAAYGKWASERIRTRKGALLSTFGLGCLIFVDDYFNCLTVGSVMRPLTDKNKVSRAKLSYLIDATAAPICMIAPISSWAAAVAGVVDEGNGLGLFIRAIPYNFYSLCTILMIIMITLMNFDFGPMKRHEMNALAGDLYTTDSRPYANVSEEKVSVKGKVIDLVLPVIVLIVCCIAGMVYTGYKDGATNFIDAFAGCDAALGLSLGSVIALLFTIVYYLCRRVLSFNDCMSAIPEGFKAMVPAILILTFAWTLSGMTGLLGADVFVSSIFEGSAAGLKMFLPAIVFAVAVGLSFATGTSWGTFGILIPIITEIEGLGAEMLVIAISACLAGAVCGDHCSPISDTTIMASTGGQCDHINHVSTQLPYAMLVAAVSFVAYIVAGITQNVFISLPVALVLMAGTLLVMKLLMDKRKA